MNTPLNLLFDYSGFEQKLTMNGQPFVAHIYDGLEDQPGFNVACVPLPAAENVVLDWRKHIKIAESYIQKGIYLLWELDMALLSGSLEDEARFLALTLAVQHFIEVIWPFFSHMTIGLVLFRGALDINLKEKMIEYLKLLASPLPDLLHCFIFLDTSNITDPYTYFRLVSDGYGPIKLALKGEFCEQYPYAVPALAWGHKSSPLGYCSKHIYQPLPQKEIKLAICLSSQMMPEELSVTLAQMGDEPFRIIPEAILEQEWDGIEQLMIWPKRVSERGWRKIRGFEASGGIVFKQS